LKANLLEEIDFDAVKKTIRQAEGEKSERLERLVEVVVTLEGLASRSYARRWSAGTNYD